MMPPKRSFHYFCLSNDEDGASPVAAPPSRFHVVENAKRFLNLVNIYERAVFELTPARCVWNSMLI